MELNMFILLLILMIKHGISERCLEDEFQCLSGECIPIGFKNDMIADCKDKSDLKRATGCLTRHDLYGRHYNHFPMLRKTSINGERCLSYCYRHAGYGIMCRIYKGYVRNEYCHVPFCGISTADDRIACDFTSSFCGWQIRSNATIKQFISEGKSLPINSLKISPGKAVIKVIGDRITRTSLVSPVIPYGKSFELIYSVNKSQNCIWKLQRFSSSNWKMGNCTECTLKATNVKKISLALWITGHGYYELTLEFSFRGIHQSKPIGKMSERCNWDQVNCNGFCRDLSIFQDGFRDCRFGSDEGVINLGCYGYDNGGKGNDCSRSEVKCKGSGKCMPRVYPLSMQKECLGGAQTSFPYNLTRTKCPSFYICKKTKRDISRNNGTICLSQKEICDGIPQCPYWDDETSCSHVYCPQGCTRCSDNRYKCSSSALLDIPSSAVSIDVSGQDVDLRDVCFIKRLRLLSLNLSHCNLSEIRCVTFKFPNLRYLDVAYNNLETPFFTPQDRLNLRLDGNPINALIFQCLKPIRHMSVKNARVRTFYTTWKSGYFQMHFRNNSLLQESELNEYMESVDFGENEIESVSFLDKFFNLLSADVSKNKISYLKNRFFLRKLTRFIANDNLLTKLTNLSFEYVRDLEVLDLSRNRICSIASDIFKTNLLLSEVYLQNNLLKRLSPSLFKHLNYLEVLRLDDNYIENLPSEMFYNQVALRTLNLKNNNIKLIPKRLFRHLASLRFLDISGNDIYVYENIFYGLVLKTLIVDKFSLCCAKPRSVTVDNCHAPSVSVSSCPYFLKSWPLGVCFWYLTILLFAGNLFIIKGHLKEKDTSNMWKKTFLVNMSIADIMIGFYIFSLGLKDVVNKGQYGFDHDEWIQTWRCDALQLLLSTSIEATVILTVIACIQNLNPLCDLDRTKLNILMLVAWVLSIALAAAYFSWNKSTSHGVSMSPQLCMVIPIIYHFQENYTNGSQYWTWIFVWLISHFSCSLMISSTEIFRTFRGPQRKRDVQQTIIFTSITVRDLFICITGFLQMEVPIPDIFHELTLFVIATCSTIGTLARFWLKPSQELNFEIKEIILIRNSSKKTSGKSGSLKTIIVFDPLLKPKIKSGIRLNDITIVLSDQTGWNQTVRKMKILRHMIKCESPIPKPDVRIDVGKLTAQILNNTNNTCIAQSTLKCEPHSDTTSS